MIWRTRGSSHSSSRNIGLSRRRSCLAAGSAVVLVVVLAGCVSSKPAPASSAPPSSGSPTELPTSSAWPSYHYDNSRAAAVGADARLDDVTQAWSTTLSGSLHNQPVVGGGRVVVADESNHVSALDPRTGKIVWRDFIGAPLTDVDRNAGCGNIDPLGVTSTPAVDLATGIVYVVGEVASSRAGGGVTVHHQLEGIEIATGRVRLSEAVDPPLPAGGSAVNLLQRASLAIANGRVYVSYGGNVGDCGKYHGWVVGVNETGAAHEVSFEVAPDGEGGAIWQSGGAPAIDSNGNLYVTTGNANPDPPEGGPDPKKYTESVVKLSPTLRPLASFKDRIAGGDEDLSTGNPVLLGNGELFAVGKTDVGYVLRQSDLSKVATITGVCGSDPDGGPAYDASLNRVFVPCRGGGIQQVELGATSGSGGGSARLGPLLAGANSAPILVGHRLWALQYPEGTLTEFDAKSDARIQSVPVGATVAHFASPAAALGLILVGTDTGVTAFGPAG
jgi:polyvinyl alcohol dehydrogenase (cytochrome)